jgi:hypothetical protein
VDLRFTISDLRLKLGSELARKLSSHAELFVPKFQNLVDKAVPGAKLIQRVKIWRHQVLKRKEAGRFFLQAEVISGVLRGT